MPHRLHCRKRDVPIAADVLVLQHVGGRDDVARFAIEPRHAAAGVASGGTGSSHPARAVVGADKGRLRGRQVGVDVVDAVHVAVVQELRRRGDPAGEATIDGDVATPDLGEAEIRVGDVQLVAGGWRTGYVGRLVLVDVGRERERGRVVGQGTALQHAGVAQLVRDPDVERLTGEHAGAAADLRLLVAVEVVVEAEARRPQDVGAGHCAAVVTDLAAVFLAERQWVGVRVVVSRVLEDRHVEAHTSSDAEIGARAPHILRVGAAVVRRQWLKRLVEARNIHVADLVAARRDGRRGDARVRQGLSRGGIEIVEAVVDVGALLAAVVERVVRVIALEAAAGGEFVLGAELGEVVLQFI